MESIVFSFFFTLFLSHSLFTSPSDFPSGVLWVNNKLVENSATVLNLLQDNGKRVFLVTNNATKSRDMILTHARERGFNITKEQIITPILSIVNYLKSLNFTKKIYLIGGAISNELRQWNFQCRNSDDEAIIDTHHSNVSIEMLNLDPDVGAVLISYHYNFHYSHILRAANYLKDPNCLFLASCMDDRIPTDKDMVLPGISCIARAIEACSYRKVLNLGKPNPALCSALLNDGITNPKRTLMIGDNARTDILLGKTCGFQTLLVGSGVHGLNDIQKWQTSQNPSDKQLIPDAYINKVGDLMKFLK